MSQPHRDRVETESDTAQLDLGPLPGLIGYVLRRAQLCVFKDFNDTCGEADVRPAIFSILTIIDRNPGARQGEVGAVLGIKRSNIVALLNEMEERGLAERRPHASDRRSHALFLTDAGDALLRRLDGLVEKHEKRFVDAVGEDGRDQLIDLLGNIQNAADLGDDR